MYGKTLQERRELLMLTLEQVADVLDDAMDILEKDGWCSGFAKLPNGMECLTQAVNTALYRRKLTKFLDIRVSITTQQPAISQVARYFLQQTRPDDKFLLYNPIDGLIYYNDNLVIPRPTILDSTGPKQTILDAGRKAAKQARIEHYSYNTVQHV